MNVEALRRACQELGYPDAVAVKLADMVGDGTTLLDLAVADPDVRRILQRAAAQPYESIV